MNRMKFLAVVAIMLLSVSVSWAKRTGKDIDVKTFKQKIAKKEIVLVDVRTAKEFAEGHIEGAMLVNFYGTNFERNITAISKKTPIYVYCRSGNRSGKAMQFLLKKGYKRVFNLVGGFKAWEEAKNGVVTE
ncbi:rhodanese-like domain-containing protein [Prolixibacteraceae bacterium JC049]|nr:rhodanese-like domain-containing protein [Prolixibacteraceae bacterium JC049]